MQDVVPHRETDIGIAGDRVKPSRDSTVQSIVRAMQIMDTLRDCRELSVTELSRRMGLHKSTTHRLLATLERGGYVRQDKSTERYSLGMKVLGLAGSLLNQLDIRTHALPVMRQLMQETHETIHLGVIVDGQVMCVESVVSPRPNAIASMAGKFTHAHVSSMGKVILANSPQSEVDAFIRQRGLPRLTKHTIVTPAAFMEELDSVRNRDYALNNEEEEIGIRCMAAVIRDHTNAPVAAISIAAPVPRLEGSVLDKLAAQLCSRALSVSRWLGAE
jgi:DNA-binding IclR family transcriptional regulator